MKIAYFVNQYPKVSHSFIRREIMALESCGVTVKRFAVRVNKDELVDQGDITELEKTHYLFDTPFRKLVMVTTMSFLAQPIQFLRVLASAIKIGIHSERGILRHCIYFLEACLLKKLLKQAEVSHVHAHFGTNSATVPLLCYKLDGPSYSFTVHGPEEFDKPAAISLDQKIRHSLFTVAISSYGRSQLYRWADYSHWKKIYIVRCGLEASFYRDAPDWQQYRQDRIVCVGRLCEQKGQLLLIEACAKLLQQGKRISLVLAGDGPMRGEISEAIAHYRLEKQVTITGWISSEQVRDEIFKARTLVLPSFAEGLPVVIMEAMALGRPVISTYVAGIPELVVPRENGWLVPAGDVEALTEAISDALQMSDNELRKLGMNGRECVLQKHSIDVEASKLHDLLKFHVIGGADE